MRLNVGGLAFTNKTDIAFSYNDWLRGTDIKINALGFAQKVGEDGTFGVSLVSMNFGDIEVTTTDNPDYGNGATFRPQFLNIGIAYARSFSNSIHGGLLIRIINEGIADVSATGVAFDAGIQYVSGENDQVKFGIALRNVGTPMNFRGDGLSTTSTAPTGAEATFEQRPNAFELPSQLSIGGAYDFYAAEVHRITLAGSFVSNSFRSDFLGLGVEYSYDELFAIRAGYNYENGMFDATDLSESKTALSGFAAGASVNIPIGENTTIKVDYAYRTTLVFDGVHSIGIGISL
ncbi:MAG: PorV/PorQ family protein [Chitinophagales bacterium]